MQSTSQFQAPFFQVVPLSAAYIPWEKHGTPVQIHLPRLKYSDSVSGGSTNIPHPHSRISVGTANFDFTPSFPCFALFLDAAHCLLLRPSNSQKYERIGIAQFCRPSVTRIKGRKVPEPTELKEGEKLSWDDILHMNLGVAGPQGTWGPIVEDIRRGLLLLSKRSTH
jgi:hypothetical protein